MKTPRYLSSFRWALAAALVTAYFGSSSVARAQDEVSSPDAGAPTPSEAPADSASPAPASAAPTSQPPQASEEEEENKAPSGDQGGPVFSLQSPQQPQKDEAKKEEKPAAAPRKNPFRGSILLLDQNMSTQTAHIETEPQQSYIPSYQIWISARPRFAITDRLSASVWLNYYKELTNSDYSGTTRYREDVFGDTWTLLNYGFPLGEKKATRVSFGARGIWGTSKMSRARGMIVTAGVTGSINHSFELAGDDAKFFNDAHVGTMVIYQHPFTTGETAGNSDFRYPLQDLNGRPSYTNQLSGMPFNAHSLVLMLDTGLSITPKLSWNVDMFIINGWRYKTKSDVSVDTGMGQWAVPRASDTVLFNQNLWFLTTLDYSLLDEVTLSLGYYNWANALGPDGQQRGLFSQNNIWWSPAARVFFDVIVHLDAVYDLIRGGSGGSGPTGNIRQARANKVINSF